MRRRAVVSVLLLAAYLPACTSFQPTSQSLVELTATPTPVDKVRITTTAGARVEVWDPRVERDTLFGLADWAGQYSAKVSIPLSMVRSAEVRKTAWAPTLVLVGTAVLLTASAISYASEESTIRFLDSSD